MVSMFWLQPFPVRPQMYYFHECISRHCITFIDFFWGVTHRERERESFWQKQRQRRKTRENKHVSAHFLITCACGLHLLRQLILREASETCGVLRRPSCGEDIWLRARRRCEFIDFPGETRSSQTFRPPCLLCAETRSLQTRP